MTFAPKTFGATAGEGMAALANSWVTTSNTLQQQELARQQAAADLLLRQQQAAQQATYQQGQLALQGQQYATDDTTLAGNKRAADFQNYVSPRYTEEFTGLADVLKNRGPAAGPAYDPGLYQHATARMAQLKKLMNGVSMTTGSGVGYEDAKAALFDFLGASDQTSGAPAAAGPNTAPMAPAATPAPTPAAPLPAIDMSFAPVARGDAVANGDTGSRAPVAPVDPAGQTAQAGPPAAAPAAMPAQPAAAPADLSSYTNIHDVPLNQLMAADSTALVKQFGLGADEYASLARSAYAASRRSHTWQASRRRTPCGTSV